MANTHLSNRDARRLFLHRHALAEAPAGPATGPALHDLITRLGFVQLDSINTVARAHDMILYSRRPRYRVGGMANLLEKDRGLFEHWTHDAAMIPMQFYPAWALKQRRDAERLARKWPEWGRDGFDSEFDRILEHIETHGPAPSSAFAPDTKRKSGGWWDWHPAKTALEYLWRRGTLEICHREGFRKFYNLSERVIPPEFQNDEWQEQQTIDFLMNGAMDRLGFATAGELAAFWDILSPKEARDWCATALQEGRLIEVDVENCDGTTRTHLARPDIQAHADAAPAPSTRMRVLSPFDPALRDRKRAERLFGFSYRIEVFTPAPKRVYGYYVFPLLEGDRLIGRIDMKADRKAGILNVTGLWPEKNVRWLPSRQARLDAELDRLIRFAGLDAVKYSGNLAL